MGVARPCRDTNLGLIAFLDGGTSSVNFDCAGTLPAPQLSWTFWLAQVSNRGLCHSQHSPSIRGRFRALRRGSGVLNRVSLQALDIKLRGIPVAHGLPAVTGQNC